MMRLIIKCSIILSYVAIVGFPFIFFISYVQNMPKLPEIYILLGACLGIPALLAKCKNCGERLLQPKNMVPVIFDIPVIPLSVVDCCPACEKDPMVSS